MKLGIGFAEKEKNDKNYTIYYTQPQKPLKKYPPTMGQNRQCIDKTSMEQSPIGPIRLLSPRHPKNRGVLGLIQGRIKTIKSYRRYALNNPILTKFMD